MYLLLFRGVNTAHLWRTPLCGVFVAAKGGLLDRKKNMIYILYSLAYELMDLLLVEPPKRASDKEESELVANSPINELLTPARYERLRPFGWEAPGHVQVFHLIFLYDRLMSSQVVSAHIRPGPRAPVLLCRLDFRNIAI